MWVTFANSRMEPGAKISIKSFFMEIIFYSVHSAAVFLSLRQKYFYSELTADCSLLVEGESIIRSILRLLRR